MTSGQSNCSCSHLLFFSWKRARRHVTLYAARTDKQLHSALYACVTHRLHLCSKSEDGGLAVGGIFSVTSVPSRDLTIPPPAPRDRCRYKETAARASRGWGGVTNISSHTREKKQTNNPCTCVLRAVPRQHFLLPDSTLHARRDPRWRGQMGSKEVVCLPVYIKPYASTSLLCVRPAICCITGKTLPSVFCSSPHPTTPGPTLHRLLRPLYHRLPELLLDDRCCQHGGLVTCIFPHSRLARCQRML